MESDKKHGDACVWLTHFMSNTLALSTFAVITMTCWHQRQPRHFFIPAVGHAEWVPYSFNISDTHDIGFLQFSNNWHFYIYGQLVFKTDNGIVNMMKKWCMKFHQILMNFLELCPVKSCATFSETPDTRTSQAS